MSEAYPIRYRYLIKRDHGPQPRVVVKTNDVEHLGKELVRLIKEEPKDARRTFIVSYMGDDYDTGVLSHGKAEQP